jgi:multidrug transporter EmrE-like cation transporter
MAGSENSPLPTRSGKALAWFALALSILCRSLVFVFAKNAAIDTAGADIYQILLNHWYWAELFMLGLQAVFWIYVLRNLNLNVAYPAMSLVYAVNLMWSWYLFEEVVTLTHIIGCGIIIVGVIMANPPRRPIAQ